MCCCPYFLFFPLTNRFLLLFHVLEGLCPLDPHFLFAAQKGSEKSNGAFLTLASLILISVFRTAAVNIEIAYNTAVLGSCGSYPSVGNRNDISVFNCGKHGF